MRTIEPPKEVGPRLLQARCRTERCQALLEFYETEMKTERGDRPWEPDVQYVTCPHCQGMVYPQS